MMVTLRSSVVAVVLVCFITLGQLTAVLAAPQLGMRPKLRVLGVDVTGSDASALLSATATADVNGPATPAVTAEYTEVDVLQPTDSPPSIGGTDVQLAAQTSSATSSSSGVGVAILIGSLAALLQTF